MLSKQKTKQNRDLLNNPRIYQDIADGVKNMLACANTSDRYNATFGADDLNHGMLKGAVMDSSVGGCANAIKRKYCNTPSDRWHASAIKGIEQDTIQHTFEDKIAVQLDTLKKLGKFPKKGLGIAIDMHLIPRYDRVPGEDLTRSKYKNGTTYFERYMTVQCVNDKMRSAGQNVSHTLYMYMCLRKPCNSKMNLRHLVNNFYFSRYGSNTLNY